MSEMSREEKLKITEYDEAARVIHLHLNKYCDESLPFPAMVADAARVANRNINELKEHFLDLLAQGCGAFNHKKAIYEYDHFYISTYEYALRYAIENGWINKSQLLRPL